MLKRIAIRQYRSIRDVTLDLGPVNVLVGPNGCGKSNLYSAVRLLTMAARGQLARALAAEGGMPSALWAGPRRRDKAVRMVVEADVDDYTYHLSFGLPPKGSTPFALDPMVKDEFLSIPQQGRKTKLRLMERDRGFAWAYDEDMSRVEFPFDLREEESILGQLADPRRFPELFDLRRRFGSWRFYDHLRTDPDAPARDPRPAIRTWQLASDGHDLAAALMTIQAHGDAGTLRDTVAEAFDGARLAIAPDERHRLEVTLTTGLDRPLGPRELSDGTLRYLYLAAALLAPEPAPLLAINEPETSLHPRLLEPLARLVGRASAKSQIWLTTHSDRLADLVAGEAGIQPIPLALSRGETVVGA